VSVGDFFKMRPWSSEVEGGDHEQGLVGFGCDEKSSGR